MNDNKSAAEFKVSFTVAKQDSHFATSSLLCHPRLQWTCWCFYPLILACCFLYHTGLLSLCLIVSAFAVVQGDTVWNRLICYEKQIHKCSEQHCYKTSTYFLGRRYFSRGSLSGDAKSFLGTCRRNWHTRTSVGHPSWVWQGRTVATRELDLSMNEHNYRSEAWVKAIRCHYYRQQQRMWVD